MQRLFGVLIAFKGDNKGFNVDEKTVRPRNDSVVIRFFGPWSVEMPIELVSGEALQIGIGISICGQVI